VTARAVELMALVVDPGAGSSAVPAPVLAAAAALLALERGTSTVPPRARARARGGGWLHVHAARLDGSGGRPAPGPVAVVIEHADADTTAPLLLAAHGLTPRETEVARLVLRGATTLAVVEELHISRHTVQDHLKAVFDKVGVRSRRELMARLLTSHH
jgi:DNA-binding CsgD family transcriptional regulator